jgi:methylglutaconyl-CoA hydratase
VEIVAAEAQRIGLLHALVPTDALDIAVNRQIDLLLKAGPSAASHAKSLIRRVVASDDRHRLDRDNADLIARLRVSPEGQEGLAAFLEKRPPGWAP